MHFYFLLFSAQNVSLLIFVYTYTKVMNQQAVIPNPNSQQFAISYPLISIIVALILMLIAVKLSKSKKKSKNTIAIIGERFSGKTQLFISLNQGKKVKTVPSIHNNKCTYKMGSKNYQIIDYIGDNISKEQVLNSLDQVHAIIHVIDGTDPKTISDAAMFIYKILVNKQYQKDNCNYLIFLNKKDLSGYEGKAKIEQKLEDQIEHIKQSRINQGQENENQDDFIKLSKNRFKIPFKIVEGSAESDIKDLQITFENL